MSIKLSDHFTYKKLFRFCLSPIIMMVFTSIYGVVDGFFISNFVGKTPFASVNLVMPVIMILGGIGFMFGTGGSALVAKTLGEGKKDKANSYFSMMVNLTVISGVILSLLGIIFMKPISIFLGATENMLADCITYGRVILIFNTAFMLQSVFQTFLTTAEKPTLGLIFTLVAGGANMLLDYVFIAFFKWGVFGAALATGISQCIGGFIPYIYFFRNNNSLLKIVKAKFEVKPIIKSCINGSSEFLTNISISLVSIVYNFQLLKFAGENGVAAYGVLMYVQFIFTGIFIGYTIATAPIIGFNYGAEKSPELKNILKKSLIITTSSGIIMMLISQALSYPLSYIFVGYDKTLLDMTNHAFKVFAFAFILQGVNIFASSFFTALNDGFVSAVISFLRTLIFQLVAVIVLPAIWELEGVWWSVTASEVMAVFVSAYFIISKAKKYKYR